MLRAVVLFMSIMWTGDVESGKARVIRSIAERGLSSAPVAPLSRQQVPPDILKVDRLTAALLLPELGVRRCPARRTTAFVRPTRRKLGLEVQFTLIQYQSLSWKQIRERTHSVQVQPPLIPPDIILPVVVQIHNAHTGRRRRLAVIAGTCPCADAATGRRHASSIAIRVQTLNGCRAGGCGGARRQTRYVVLTPCWGLLWFSFLRGSSLERLARGREHLGPHLSVELSDLGGGGGWVGMDRHGCEGGREGM